MSEEHLTFIDIYNKITGQAWSMFDSEVEDKDEFESAVTTSIQKALSALWCSFKFPFRIKEQKTKVRAGVASYNAPAGNIIQKSSKGSKVYSVICNKKYLNYEPDYNIKDEASGTPEYFYIKNGKIYFYPTPDDNYEIKIEYLSFNMACDESGNTKANLEEDTDYIDIDERYNDLFLNALMPLAMVYLIASDTDENYKGYKEQYDKAYKNLIDFCKGLEFDKKIGW